MAKSLQRINKSREDLVKKVIENMEEGYFFQREKWNSNLLKPHNPYSKAYYKGSNRFRLLYEEDSKGYNDSRWLTFKQIELINEKIKEKDKQLKIKDKEKGTLLEKWIWQEIKEEIDEETGEEKKTLVNLKKPIVRYFYVFYGEQIENMPPMELRQIQENDITKTADTFVKSSLCPIEEKFQDEAFYNPILDRIILPPRNSFKNDKTFLGVLLHEMSHSTGHEGRIERKIRNLFGDEDYAKEELRAELSSLFLLSDLDISDRETFQDNTNYLKSWIEVLKDDPNELFKAANEAEVISEFLMQNYEKELAIEKNEIMNEEGIEKMRKLLLNIKEWYEKEYPNDEIGATLNNNVNFLDLHNLLYSNNGEKVYELLGEYSDSVVRERCFKKLSELENIPYSEIYDKWLGIDEKAETNKENEEICV